MRGEGERTTTPEFEAGDKSSLWKLEAAKHLVTLRCGKPAAGTGTEMEMETETKQETETETRGYCGTGVGHGMAVAPKVTGNVNKMHCPNFPKFLAERQLKFLARQQAQQGNNNVGVTIESHSWTSPTTTAPVIKVLKDKQPQSVANLFSIAISYYIPASCNTVCVCVCVGPN